jgi:leucyl-tRNA synthetase
MVCHATFKDKETGKWLSPADALARKPEEVIFGRSEKMSKSKKNTVEPASIVESYGADTTRLFMLSDTPPSRDLEWSESGIDGCWKYANRLWKLVASNRNTILGTQRQGSEDFKMNKFSNASESKDYAIIRLTHKTIASVKDEYEKMGFNRAIAKIREFSNALEKSESIPEFALKNLVILISPIMPHLAEELWAELGYKTLVTEEKFPEFDPNLIVEDEIGIAVQVSGKLRAVIQMSKGSSKEDLEKAAFGNENVKRFIEGKEIRKVISVADKLVNIVV